MANKYNDFGYRDNLKGKRLSNKKIKRAFLQLFQAVRQRDGPLVNQFLEQVAARVCIKNDRKFSSLLRVNAKSGDINITRSLIHSRAFSPEDVTDLHIAVSCLNFDIASELIRSGANVCAKNRNGNTPLDAAIVGSTRTYELFDALMLDFPLVPDARKSYNFVKRAQASVGHIISSRKDAAQIKLRLVKMLLDSGAKVNHKDKNGCSPIHLAVVTGDLKLVEMLLDAGADMNSKNKIGVTALHNAVMSIDNRVVYLLLKRGASVTVKTNQGDTALHWALLFNQWLDNIGNTHDAIFSNLLAFGSNVNEKNAQNQTIVELLIQHQEIETCCMVIEYVAEIEVQTNQPVFDEESLTWIKQDQGLQTHYLKNQVLLTIMKNRKIGSTSITYLSVLTKPVKVLARRAKNKDLVKEFNASDYQTAFPHHKLRLYTRIKAAAVRRRRIDKICEILHNVLAFADKNNPAYEMIAECLSVADMKFLIATNSAKAT